jgi:cytoskeletal protein CcmA (bactofilin family)
MAENVTSTIIGESILINGNLNGEEDLTVLGRVEGTINLTKTLNIEESGIVKANISVRNAIVSGVVVGNITATDSVEITEVGRMVGDIKAPRVIIVDGARYRGAVDMGDMEAPRASGPMPVRAEKALVRSPVATRPALPPARRPSPAAPAAATPVRKAAPSAPAQAPVLATAKKIKKKVVVKKKVEE